MTDDQCPDLNRDMEELLKLQFRKRENLLRMLELFGVRDPEKWAKKESDG